MIDYRDHINVDAEISLTGQIKSSLTGLAPFLVASSLLVSNLNADLLDGLHASSFALASHSHDVYTKAESDDRFLNSSASNIGWNSIIGNKSRLNFSSTDGPSGASVYHGLWIAQSATYGTAIAFRNGSMRIRSVENGVIGDWITIANQNWATPNTRSILTGNGLTGGGNLTEDRTLTLGTPSAITLSSVNTVTGTSHTHAFTPGGTTAQYIRGDGSLAAFPAIPAGTVTSVGLSVPLGFSASPASITTSGTFALSFASGYSLPTTAKQTQWDAAYTYSQVGHIVDNNDAWKFRGTFNALDANTLVLPGWYDNGSSSPTSTNIPLVKAGFLNVTPFKSSSFVGGVQEYSSVGLLDSNLNRRFWRSYWAGTFYSWREYAAVDWVESQGYAKLPINAVDWLTVDTGTFGGQLRLNTSSTNSPSAGAWHGLWIPQNTAGTYGTNIVFRNNAASIRSKENGVWQLWNPLITQSILAGRLFTINGTDYNLGSNQTISVGDVNSFGAKTEGALTAWDASGQLISTGINVVGNTYTLGPANNTVKTIKFNYGSNEVGFQISNWSSAASMGPHAAIYTGSNGAPDGYGRLALVARPTDDSNGRIDFRVGSARDIKMYLNYNGDLNLTGRFYSTVATGQSPLVVSSQTVVSNLNADLLDGLHSSAFALSVHSHTFASLTEKPTTLSGYGITDAYTKIESDGRYIQGTASNYLQAVGFANSDYDLNTANTVRGHGGSTGYTNGPAMSASGDAYRTVITFDAHSPNAIANIYKSQLVFNSANQFAFRQQFAGNWSSWAYLVVESQIANFITASSSNTLTNKSGNISMWTNNTGYITGINSGMISSALGFTPASNAIGINTTNSLTGGGNLTTSRTLQLVGDSASPGNSRYYGTNASGTKGWHALPSGGSGTVTQVGLLVPTGFTVTSSPVTTSGNLQFAFASGYSLPTTASQNAWNAKVGGSGTVNRIPLFTAGSTLGDSPIYHNGGNIGIGTSPSHKFQVAGNSYLGGDVFATGTISTSSNCAASTGFSTVSGGYYAGTNSLHSSAIGQFDSTTKGFLIPRMTMTQFNSISGKQPGLIAMIVNPVDSNDILGMMFYTGSTTKYFQAI